MRIYFMKQLPKIFYAKNDATKDEMRAACEAAQIWKLIDHYLMV